MAERSVVFLTQFVCHPGALAGAEALYRRRVSEIDSAVAIVEDVDVRALPADDEFLLWELRDAAAYEGIDDVEALELYQISSRIRLSEDDDRQVIEQLFFCSPGDSDPFPAQVRSAPSSDSTPTPDRVTLLADGTWLLTVYALVPQEDAPEAVFDDLRSRLKVTATSAITEVSPEDPDYARVFGPLVLDRTRALLSGADPHQDYPAGRLRLRQRMIVHHSGPVRALGGGAVAVTAEPMTVL